MKLRALAATGVALAALVVGPATAGGPVMGQRCSRAQWGVQDGGTGGVVCVAVDPSTFVWGMVPGNVAVTVVKKTAAKPAAGATTGTIPGDGTYVVGKQVAPGTYQSTGPKAGRTICGWFKLDATGEPTDSDVSQGQVIVVVAPTDAMIRTSGCLPFTRMN